MSLDRLIPAEEALEIVLDGVQSIGEEILRCDLPSRQTYNYW